MTGTIPRRLLLTGATAGAIASCRSVEPPTRPAPADETLAGRVQWGAYASPEPFPDCAAHFELERAVRRQFTMSWFSTWGLAWPGRGGQEAAERRKEIHFAWQPRLADGEPVQFSDLLAGRHDDYLARFFAAVAAHPRHVTIRFAHEMNTRSYPWALGYTGDPSIRSTQEYVEGWRYVVEAGRAAGAQNISWAWCIATRDRGPAPAEDYFPGPDVVDVLAMDVYVGYGGYWQNPHAAIATGYDRLTPLAADLPVWITELGCREPSKVEAAGEPIDPGRDKAQWLRDLFSITDFPRLAAIDLFHAEKQHDWRLDSGPGTLEAVRTALGS